MQTPAEVFLIEQIIIFLKNIPIASRPAKIINLGAGKSFVIEDSVAAADPDFTVDRTDVYECRMDNPRARTRFVCSADKMPEVPTENYDLGFSNYVLEHVANLPDAAKEIYRVIKPGGIFAVSTPNPQAPEFFISRHTPLFFHQLIKGKGKFAEAYETFYAYKNIGELIKIFIAAGFKAKEVKFYPFTIGYLFRFPIISIISRLYDKLISLLGAKPLMGQVGIVFEKRSRPDQGFDRSEP
ncbi:MAG: methyltransferase domain-containing protein [Patescibacteria group bacterium]|nr:methyltransferase domain-containing protein [Patescibacteria group bacterium]